MVSRQLRSRSKKRRSIRTPSGKAVIHYGRKKPKKINEIRFKIPKEHGFPDMVEVDLDGIVDAKGFLRKVYNETTQQDTLRKR